MYTAKERILANYALTEGTFYYDFVEEATFTTTKFISFLDDVYEVTNDGAGKPFDQELAVALNAIQTYLFESCMYHAQERDNYEIELYPGNNHMTVYLNALKELIACFYQGKTAVKPCIDMDEELNTFLAFLRPLKN